MKFFVVSIACAVGLFGQIFGVVLEPSDSLSQQERLVGEIESLFAEQNGFYASSNSVKVILDDGTIQKGYNKKGRASLIALAKKNGFATVTLVRYKKHSRNLLFVAFVADEKVQDKKSLTKPFGTTIGRELGDTILSGVLMLNYQLGVFNEKTLY